jgi:CYTH domain-containing protein
MTGVEIERKFLVAELPPELNQHPGQRIEQGYLAIAPDGVEVRVRRRDGQATLTVKSGPGQVRTEEEMAIDERRFDALWRLTEGRRVSKTRHELPLEDGAVAELDVYDGELDGLLTVEIEFDSVDASERFTPPPWVGRELTGDARYANQSLALEGRPPES